MEHTHRLIIICDHILERADKYPDVIWVESGEVQAAVCLTCARDANEANAYGEEPPAAMKPICAECARVESIPTVAKMADGFYECHDGQWVQQADASAEN